MRHADRSRFCGRSVRCAVLSGDVSRGFRAARFGGAAWVVLTCATALFLGACAGSQQRGAASAPLPATQAEARTELDGLEAQIDENRLALGLPARPALAKDEEEAGWRVQGQTAKAPPAASPPTPAERAPAAPAHAEPAAESTGMDADEGSLEARSSCDPRCRHTRAICDAAERICRLARWLGEPDAARRCTRAQQDCRDARQVTAGQDCDGC